MAAGYELKRLRPTMPAFEALRDESRREGYWMLVRLGESWAAGRNTFRKRGEVLLGAFFEGGLVGVCGLNVDPYFDDRRYGRVRHLYVTPEHRRNGVGRLLLSAIVDKARDSFAWLNTRAPEAAFAFYEALGFKRVEGEEHVTHRRALRPKRNALRKVA